MTCVCKDFELIISFLEIFLRSVDIKWIFKNIIWYAKSVNNIWK